MNAAKLKDPFRMLESVYNDIQLECAPSNNETCEDCMESTKKFRDDFLSFTNDVVQIVVTNNDFGCVTRPSKTKKSAEDLKDAFALKACSTELGVDSVMAMSPCLANKKFSTSERHSIQDYLVTSLGARECHRGFNTLASSQDVCDATAISDKKTCIELRLCWVFLAGR